MLGRHSQKPNVQILKGLQNGRPVRASVDECEPRLDPTYGCDAYSAFGD